MLIAFRKEGGKDVRFEMNRSTAAAVRCSRRAHFAMKSVATTGTERAFKADACVECKQNGEEAGSSHPLATSVNTTPSLGCFCVTASSSRTKRCSLICTPQWCQMVAAGIYADNTTFHLPDTYARDTHRCNHGFLPLKSHESGFGVVIQYHSTL